MTALVVGDVFMQTPAPVISGANAAAVCGAIAYRDASTWRCARSAGHDGEHVSGYAAGDRAWPNVSSARAERDAARYVDDELARQRRQLGGDTAELVWQWGGFAFVCTLFSVAIAFGVLHTGVR